MYFEDALASTALLRSARNIEAIYLDHFRKPAPAVLDDTFLGLPIHMHQPEALTISQRPLEVIQQRPVEIALYGNTIFNGAMDLCNMIPQIADAAFVAHTSIKIHAVGDGDSFSVTISSQVG